MSILKLENILITCFLFKLNLLRQIYVSFTNMSFCEWLSFNILCRAFINFTIVVLTCYYFTSYSIVLPISIYAFVFWLWSIYFTVGVLLYITT